MNIAVTLPEAEILRSDFFASKHRLLIDGKWVEAKSGKTFDVFNPATGQVIAHAADAGKEDVDLAVQAARRAFEDGPWSRMPPSQRALLIFRLADAIDAIGDEMALIETLDVGRPIKVARGHDVAGAVDRLRYYAGWATKISGSTLPVTSQNPKDFLAYTLREPVGVCGLIVPWNAPLVTAVSKLGPALAAGCTVILKPAEQTPLSALRLGQLIQEVGFPDGVVNILTGFGETGAAMVDHRGIDKVSFTGSTEVGKQIVRASTGNLKRVTLELGGKSPVIVFPDADMTTAIEGAARGIFSNTGQVCAAGSRLFAHERVFDQLVEGVAANARKIKVGPGIDPETEMGPVVSQEHLERVTGYMKAGRDAGANVVTGGGRAEGKGYYVQPTILTQTTTNMSVWREEIFGPVLCAMSFSDADLDRILAEANDTDYGLAAYIFTRDLSVAHRTARKIKAGSVRINGGMQDIGVPFGGYKQSGWGRENALEGIEIYTEIKSVTVAL